jgi:hypothetical protein
MMFMTDSKAVIQGEGKPTTRERSEHLNSKLSNHCSILEPTINMADHRQLPQSAADEHQSLKWLGWRK